MPDSTLSVELPGRLGTPGMVLREDPRVDPRLVAALAPFGLVGAPEPAPVDVNSPVDAILEYSAAAEEGFEGLFAALTAGAPPIEGVLSTTRTITGIDGNDITLFVHRPSGETGPLPGVLHIHGGGMVILSAAGPIYTRWRESLAASGMVVVGVEFRNGAGVLGDHPFPAGLNDCASALEWVDANREKLGVSKLIVSGESGGGNLTLATALKAKQDGTLDRIDGVYAQCPYISNGYAEMPAELPSLQENDGYFLECAMMAALTQPYDPEGANATNPLTWPYYAKVKDVEGLPPHVISVNQLDPLRDEGLAYYAALVHAGVSAVSRTVNGTTHAGDLMFPAALPDVYAATIRDIKGFADSL